MPSKPTLVRLHEVSLVAPCAFTAGGKPWTGACPGTSTAMKPAWSTPCADVHILCCPEVAVELKVRLPSEAQQGVLEQFRAS